MKDKDSYYPPPVSQDIQIELEKVFSQHLLEKLNSIASWREIRTWLHARGSMLMDDQDVHTGSRQFKSDFPDTAGGDLRRELVSAYLGWWDKHGPAVMREIIPEPDPRYVKKPMKEIRFYLSELALPVEVSERLLLQRQIELGDPAVQPIQTRKRYFGKRKEEK